MTIAGQRFRKHVPAATNRCRINARYYEGRSLQTDQLSTRCVSVTTDKKQTFSTVAIRLYKEPCREARVSRNSAFVRELRSVQLWSANQRITEAEVVTDS
jgi:hypothetical protein